MTRTSTLKRLLDDLRIPQDGVLQVHASFRGLSEEGWKPETVCGAFTEYMSNGTLLMPAMSWSIVTPRNPVFDVRTTPCQTGILSETFRTQYAEHRSLHPTHSVCGVGRLAAELLSQHSRDGTPCGNYSPYGRISTDGVLGEAFVILIGTGFECCTAIHRPEEAVAPDIYLQPPEKAEDYELVAMNGVISTISLRRHARRVRDFQQYGHILAARNALRITTLGNVGFIAADMRLLMQIVEQRLRSDPYVHFPYRAYVNPVHPSDE
ncbi:MAG: hypothetical protein COW30_00705 [Rhodospirillales bacterium CG15_BIG_FIL_POST_REV_8_21_14_020_66_15]|nr:MAG: hypothetical protein COW30_00705 [Rhodospirillales bacterium CG15_BIG_FIL_POST_REV_8_21_14_020_66_15]